MQHQALSTMKMWKITIYKNPVQDRQVAQQLEAGKLLKQVCRIDVLPSFPSCINVSLQIRQVVKHVSWLTPRWRWLRRLPRKGTKKHIQKKTPWKLGKPANQPKTKNWWRVLPVHQVLHPLKRLSGTMMWAPRNSREKWGQCQWHAWKLHGIRHLNLKFRYPL